MCNFIHNFWNSPRHGKHPQAICSPWSKHKRKQKQKKNQASRLQIVMQSGYYKASVNCLIKLMEQKHTNSPCQFNFNFTPTPIHRKCKIDILKYWPTENNRLWQDIQNGYHIMKWQNLLSVFRKIYEWLTLKAISVTLFSHVNFSKYGCSM